MSLVQEVTWVKQEDVVVSDERFAFALKPHLS